MHVQKRLLGLCAWVCGFMNITQSGGYESGDFKRFQPAVYEISVSGGPLGAMNTKSLPLSPH